MATEEIASVRHTCDARCGTVKLLPRGEKPDGIHIALLETWRDGRLVAKDGFVWACRPGCLRKAVDNVTRAALDAEDENARQDGANGG